MSGQQHAPAVLYPRERPSSHCTGGWVWPQGWSGWAENIAPLGLDPRTIQPVAQSLYRLSYPAHKYINYTFFKISTIFKSHHRLHTVRLTCTQIQSNSVYCFTLYPATTGFNINFPKVYPLGRACCIHVVFS
jgi:hypothetical protein